jgi:ABC-2 type transport system ATP-binding protein
MPARISAANISKSYNGTQAVDDVSINVDGGEIVGFLGPNGAGKTTTLKLLTGLLKPDSGRIEICGFDISEKPDDAKSRIGYVPDTPHLYDKLTPLEFLKFIADVFRLPKETALRRIEDLVTLFDLTDYKNGLISSLSHGNKQKVSLAAAVLHRPAVLLLDEPTGGLDPRAARKIKDVIIEMAKNGCAVLFSTHILEIAENICHRIYIIDKGTIVADGKTSDIKESIRSGSTLEDLFIELTGGSEIDEVVRYLKN